MYRAFYATRIQAERLGYTLKKRATISREEANKLRNYYEALEDGKTTIISILITVLGVGFKSVISAAIGVATSISTFALSDYIEDLDNKFDMLATSKDNISFVEYTFRYRQHGSGGGAYFLEDVKLV